MLPDAGFTPHLMSETSNMRASLVESSNWEVWPLTDWMETEQRDDTQQWNEMYLLSKFAGRENNSRFPSKQTNKRQTGHILSKQSVVRIVIRIFFLIFKLSWWWTDGRMEGKLLMICNSVSVLFMAMPRLVVTEQICLLCSEVLTAERLSLEIRCGPPVSLSHQQIDPVQNFPQKFLLCNHPTTLILLPVLFGIYIICLKCNRKKFWIRKYITIPHFWIAELRSAIPWTRKLIE